MEEWSRVIERLAQKRNKTGAIQQSEAFVFELTGEKGSRGGTAKDAPGKYPSSLEKENAGAICPPQQGRDAENQYWSQPHPQDKSAAPSNIATPKPNYDSKGLSSSKPRTQIEKGLSFSCRQVLQLSNYTYSKTSERDPSESTLRSLPMSTQRSPSSVFGYFKRAGQTENTNKQQPSNAKDVTQFDLSSQGVMIRQELKSLGDKLRSRMREEGKEMELRGPTHKTVKEASVVQLFARKTVLERFDTDSQSQMSESGRRNKSIENSLTDIRESISAIRQNIRSGSVRRNQEYVSVRQYLGDRNSTDGLSESSQSQYYLHEWTQDTDGPKTRLKTGTVNTKALDFAGIIESTTARLTPTNHNMDRVSVSKFNTKAEELGSTQETLYLSKGSDAGRNTTSLLV